MFHTAVCDLLGIRVPILQGAMQGGGGVDLVAAVSNAGGLGVLPTFGGPDKKLRQDIAAVRERTSRPFGVNIMPMGRGITERCVATCIELRVPVVTTGRADPGEDAVHKLKAAGIKVVSVIPTVEHARRMEAEGVDAVVASGTEAGGHVGTIATMPLVPMVVDAVKIPVLAAGGIGDAPHAGLGHPYDTFGHLWGHPHRPVGVDLERDQVALVHPNEGGSHGQGTIQLVLVVDLHQGIEADLAGQRMERGELAVVEGRRDEQHGIGTHEAGIADVGG